MKMLRYLILLCAVYAVNTQESQVNNSKPAINEIHINEKSDSKDLECIKTTLEIKQNRKSKVSIYSPVTLYETRCFQSDNNRAVIIHNELHDQTKNKFAYSATATSLNTAGNWSYKCTFKKKQCEIDTTDCNLDLKCKYDVHVVEQPESFNSPRITISQDKDTSDSKCVDTTLKASPNDDNEVLIVSIEDFYEASCYRTDNKSITTIYGEWKEKTKPVIKYITKTVEVSTPGNRGYKCMFRTQNCDKTNPNCTNPENYLNCTIDVHVIALNASEANPTGYLTINDTKFNSSETYNYTFNEEETVHLNCYRTIGDSAELSYIETDGNPITISDPTESIMDVILNATVHDKYVIKCTIYDGSWNKTIEVSLQVKAREPNPTGYLTINDAKFNTSETYNNTFTEGETVLLNCHRTTGDSAKLTYTRPDGNPITISDPTELKVEVILNATVHNKSVIKCIISNASWNKTIEVSLHVKAREPNPTGYLTINDAKFNTSETYNKTFTEGETVQLNCHRTTGDLAKLTYTRPDGNSITISNRTESKVDVILNATVHDKSVIKCIISNASWNETIEVSLHVKAREPNPTGYLTINDAKFNTSETYNKTFTEGETVQLNCHRTTGDLAKLTYTRPDGNSITISNRTESKVDVILNATVHDKSVIKCIISNASWNETIEVSLHVKAREPNPTGYLTINDAKFNTSETYNKTFTEGETVQLNCHRTTGDLAKLTYTRPDGNSITISNRTESKVDVILNTTVHDKSVIKCIISNASWNETIEVSLHVKAREPNPTGYLTINDAKFNSSETYNNTFTEGETVQLNCHRTTGDSAKLTYTRPEAKPTGYLTINDTKFNSSGTYNYTFNEEESVHLNCHTTTGDLAELTFDNKTVKNDTIEDYMRRLNFELTSIEWDMTLYAAVNNNSVIKCTITDASKKETIEVRLITELQEEETPAGKNSKNSTISTAKSTNVESDSTTRAGPDRFTFGFITVTFMLIAAVL